MVKIGFEDVGKYDKATFVCLHLKGKFRNFHFFPFKVLLRMSFRKAST